MLIISSYTLFRTFDTNLGFYPQKLFFSHFTTDNTSQAFAKLFVDYLIMQSVLYKSYRISNFCSTVICPSAHFVKILQASLTLYSFRIITSCILFCTNHTNRRFFCTGIGKLSSKPIWYRQNMLVLYLLQIISFCSLFWTNHIKSRIFPAHKLSFSPFSTDNTSLCFIYTKLFHPTFYSVHLIEFSNFPAQNIVLQSIYYR